MDPNVTAKFKPVANKLLEERYGPSVFNVILEKDPVIMPLQIITIRTADTITKTYDEVLLSVAAYKRVDGYLYKYVSKSLKAIIIWIALDLNGELIEPIRGPKNLKDLKEVVNKFKTADWIQNALNKSFNPEEFELADLKLHWDVKGIYRNELGYYYETKLTNKQKMEFEYITINPIDGTVTRGDVIFDLNEEILLDIDNN